eukprot:8981656-Heterocapsa_arctica.AAC.1
MTINFEPSDATDSSERICRITPFTPFGAPFTPFSDPLTPFSDPPTPFSQLASFCIEMRRDV